VSEEPAAEEVAEGEVTPAAGSSSPVSTRSTRSAANRISGEDKLRLQKCSNLTQLRAQLLKVKDCEAKLGDFRANVRDAQFEAEAAAALVAKARGSLPSPRKTYKSPRKPSTPTKGSFASPRKNLHPLLKEFSSVDIEVPLTPTKTPTKNSPMMSPLPAHKRFQHLLHDESSADKSTALPMPLKYRVLREMFTACDTVVSLMYNRNENVTFSKLQPAVQKTLRRSFIQRHLGQLKAVYPLAYIFRQDKVRQAGPDGVPKLAYDLTITPNLEQSNTSSTKTDLTERLEGLRTTDGSRKLDSSALVRRREAFQSSLMTTLHRHHTEYLASILPDTDVPPPSAIHRWHADFPLEEAPDIDAADLPAPPDCQSYSTAASALSVARNLFAVNPRFTAAVERVANASSDASKSTSTSAASTPTKVIENSAATPPTTPKSLSTPTAGIPTTPISTPTNSALKGVSASLLAKIRAKEAAASKRDMTRSSKDTEQLSVLSSLPEVARILRQTAVGQGKWAMPWGRALTALRDSHSGAVGPSAADNLLSAALKEAPELLTKHLLSAGVFLKVNKSADFNAVVSKLQGLVAARA